MQHPRLSVLLCIAQISSAVGLDITVTSTSRTGTYRDWVADWVADVVGRVFVAQHRDAVKYSLA